MTVRSCTSPMWELCPTNAFSSVFMHRKCGGRNHQNERKPLQFSKMWFEWLVWLSTTYLLPGLDYYCMKTSAECNTCCDYRCCDFYSSARPFSVFQKRCRLFKLFCALSIYIYGLTNAPVFRLSGQRITPKKKILEWILFQYNTACKSWEDCTFTMEEQQVSIDERKI